MADETELPDGDGVQNAGVEKPRTAQEYAELWRSWAVANQHRAELLEKENDGFGASLCRARAAVRAEAADLVLRCKTVQEAAQVMHERVCRLWVRTLPIVGFDKAAVEYTRARTWQGMALALDPRLPVVQERLE